MQPISFVALVSLALSLLLMPPYIKWLKSKQIQQYIREEGPQSHAAKAQTPTMGGLCFMAVSVLVAVGFMFFWSGQREIVAGWGGPVALFFNSERLASLAVLGTALFCGLVGFVDDFAKLTSKSNKGLSASVRLLVEFGLGLLLAAMLFFSGSQTILYLFGSAVVLTGWPQAFYLLVVVPFLIAATTNAINLHDGMDGLAAGTSSLVFIVLFLVLTAVGKPDLVVICAAMTGALAGFLFFNKYPAKVFMGDTGSLYIGGMLAAVVAASGLIFWFIPLAVLYIAETVSVMAQVAYFKLTKPYTPAQPMSAPALVILKLTKRLPGEGKRLLRMAPLHHHFEAIASEQGRPEWTTVSAFLFVQIALCAATYAVWCWAFNLI